MTLPPKLPPDAAFLDAQGCSTILVCYELQTLKVPVGFRERMGVKLTHEEPLSERQLRQLLEAAHEYRETNVTRMPKATAFDGHTVTIRAVESRDFVTGLEVVKVKGQTVFVPKNKSIELGEVFTLRGHLLADLKRISLRATITRTSLVGNVELVPIVTPITPIFEGGARGAPVPLTQHLQMPDVKTELVEKHAIVPTEGTVILGSWKETDDPRPNGKPKKEKSKVEYEVVALVTVRVSRAEPVAVPLPRVIRAAEWWLTK